MALVCHLKSLNAVTNLGADMYRYSVSGVLMNIHNSTFDMEFDAEKGADVKVAARNAAVQYCMDHLGEAVDTLSLIHI